MEFMSPVACILVQKDGLGKAILCWIVEVWDHRMPGVWPDAVVYILLLWRTGQSSLAIADLVWYSAGQY